ncbi:MAG: hypothetical protein AAF414_22625 [Pseudomonadota bacterium]
MVQRHLARMAAALAFAWILIAASAASAQDISGGYAMSGTDFDGFSYSGTTTITRTGATYAIEQNDGGSILAGTALYSGSTLAAVFVVSGETFLAIYDRQPDGSFSGTWTALGQSVVGNETLVPLAGGSGGGGK